MVHDLVSRASARANNGRNLAIHQWDRENVGSTGLECAGDLPEYAVGFDHVFDHVLGDHHIEMPIRKGLIFEVLTPIATRMKMPRFKARIELAGDVTWALSGQFLANPAWTGRTFVDLKLSPLREVLLQYHHERPFSWNGAASCLAEEVIA